MVDCVGYKLIFCNGAGCDIDDSLCVEVVADKEISETPDGPPPDGSAQEREIEIKREREREREGERKGKRKVKREGAGASEEDDDSNMDINSTDEFDFEEEPGSDWDELSDSDNNSNTDEGKNDGKKALNARSPYMTEEHKFQSNYDLERNRRKKNGFNDDENDNNSKSNFYGSNNNKKSSSSSYNYGSSSYSGSYYNSIYYRKPEIELLNYRLNDLLKYYMSEKEFDYRCEICRNDKVKSKSWFVRLPRIFVIHVKRFQHKYESNTGQFYYWKLRHYIKIEDKIDVGEFCCDNRMLKLPPNMMDEWMINYNNNNNNNNSNKNDSNNNNWNGNSINSINDGNETLDKMFDSHKNWKKVLLKPANVMSEISSKLKTIRNKYNNEKKSQLDKNQPTICQMFNNSNSNSNSSNSRSNSNSNNNSNCNDNSNSNSNCNSNSSSNSNCNNGNINDKIKDSNDESSQVNIILEITSIENYLTRFKHLDKFVNDDDDDDDKNRMENDNNLLMYYPEYFEDPKYTVEYFHNQMNRNNVTDEEIKTFQRIQQLKWKQEKDDKMKQLKQLNEKVSKLGNNENNESNENNENNDNGENEQNGQSRHDQTSVAGRKRNFDRDNCGKPEINDDDNSNSNSNSSNNSNNSSNSNNNNNNDFDDGEPPHKRQRLGNGRSQRSSNMNSNIASGGNGDDDDDDIDISTVGNNMSHLNVSNVSNVSSNVLNNEELGIKYPQEYRLVCLVRHLGSEARHGHYICDVYDRYSDSWERHDDQYLKAIAPTSATGKDSQQTAYMFFYVHNSFINKQLKNDNHAKYKDKEKENEKEMN